MCRLDSSRCCFCWFIHMVSYYRLCLRILQMCVNSYTLKIYLWQLRPRWKCVPLKKISHASARQLGHYKPRIILSLGLEVFLTHMYETSFPSEHSPRLEVGIHLAFFCWWHFFSSVTFLVQPQGIPALCIFNPNSLPSYTQPLSSALC